MMSPPQSKTIKIQLSKGSRQGTKHKLKDVHIVTCPPAFPQGFKPKNENDRVQHRQYKRFNNADDSAKRPQIDFIDTSREVYSLGSTGFTGTQLKRHKASEYEETTGRKLKGIKTPLKIVRGMREKQAKREKKIEKEAKEAGIVLATKKKEKKRTVSQKNRRDTKLHGPSPNIGFMKKGIYRVEKGGRA